MHVDETAGILQPLVGVFADKKVLAHRIAYILEHLLPGLVGRILRDSAIV